MRRIVWVLVFSVLYVAILSAQTWVSKVGGGGLGNPLTYNPLNTNILYGSAFSPQIYISRNRGYNWSTFGNTVPGGGVIKSIAINPLDTLQILCGVKGGALDKIVKSTNGGTTWTQTWLGTFSYFGKPVEFKPSHPDTVYTMSNDSLWRSINFGSTWSLVRRVTGFNAWCDAELHPVDGSIMFIGDYTSGIWKTTDYGASWAHVFTTSGNGEVPSIALDPLNTNVAYAGRYADGGGILKTTDGGSNWFCIPTPIKPVCGTTNGGNSWWITCSPVHRGHVYFGTYGSTVHGIYFSRDSGATWSVFNAGLGASGVLNYGLLTLDSLTVIALQEDGIYKLQYPTAIHLTSPNGGEHWKTGSTHAITWSDSALYYVKIQYSSDNGSSWTTIADSVPAGQGSYNWTVPHTLSFSYKVRIIDQLFTATADTSDSSFEIFRTPPLLTTPQGGESWETGTVQNITWNTVPELTLLDIYYSFDAGAHWNLITTQSAATDTFHWTIPNSQSIQCKVRIVDATDSLAADTSNGFFTIYATQNFTAKIFVEDNGSAIDSLVFGTLPGATDGIDTAFGEVILSPKPPAGTFDTRWQHELTNGIRIDIRDTLGNGQTDHLFVGNIQPGPGGFPMTLTWDSTLLRTNTFILRDTNTHGDLVNVDMRKSTSVRVTNPSLGAFEILECQGVSVPMSQWSGWNLISLPVIVGDRRAGTLFPYKYSSAFSYASRYQQNDTLEYGVGYWVKSPGVTMTGCPRLIDTLFLQAGWNMIGALSVPVPTASIIPQLSFLSQFFGYTGASYSIVSTLMPGRGYWVKVGQAGQLIMSASPQPFPKDTEKELIGFHVLTIGDETGRKQQLFIGHDDPSIHEEEYELPPPAPTGVFDVGFAHRRILAVLPNNFQKPIEFPIFISSETKKIFFSLGVENEENFTYILKREFGDHVVSETPLKNGGTVVLPYDRQSFFSLKIQQSNGSAESPREYVLGDVFPNPFNPTAHFAYTVPSLSHVQIQIFSVLGEEVITLVDAQRSPGHYEATWDGVRFDGLPVSSGVYYMRMSAHPLTETEKSDRSDYSITKKLLFLK